MLACNVFLHCGTIKTYNIFVISCISQEQNLIFGYEASFHQFPTWLLPGLRKMLTSTISPTGGVTVVVRPAIFEHICNNWIGRCYSQCLLNVWQMLLPIIFDIVSPVRCYN